jgi:8-oxo-dGTP pyrophosphatase MutT (NUDIX family)
VTFIDNTWYQRPDRARTRTSAGGVVVRLAERDVMVALVLEAEMTLFVLPKGGVEKGETYEQAARREIVEEAGLSDLHLLRPLATLERLSYNKKNWITTHYFLFATDQIEGRPTDTRHHYGVWWFPIGALPVMLWPDQQALIQSNAELIEGLTRQHFSSV